MSKLYYRYGAMGSGKTTALLQVKYNYDSKGMKTMLIKPLVDTKGADTVVSRIGIAQQVDALIGPDDIIVNYLDKEDMPKAIIVDEAQFMTPAQIDELYLISKIYDIAVLAYGLRADFQMKGFPGSIRLLEIADDIEELKTVCNCGRKATQNLRTLNGEPVFEGDQVVIDGATNYEYEGVCGRCYVRMRYKRDDF